MLNELMQFVGEAIIAHMGAVIFVCVVPVFLWVTLGGEDPSMGR